MSLRKYFLTACMLFRYREIDNEARSPTRPQTFSLRVFLLSDDGLWRLEARPNRGAKNEWTPGYSCPTGRARPDPARLARITNRAGLGRPTCRALCTSTARWPLWCAGPARYARRASWAVPARARLGICTRPSLPQLRMISRFQI